MLQVESGTWVVTDDAGVTTWQGESTKVAADAGPLHTDTVILTGVGPNHGLSAYLLADFTDETGPFQGVVFPGDMPEGPALPPSE